MAAPSARDHSAHSAAAAALCLSSPIRIFSYFHKAFRAELEELHQLALALSKNKRDGDFKQLVDKCQFLSSVYRHHCNAEDEVILPALDIRVKNVVQTYSLEHEGARVLFDQLFELLDNDMRTEECHNRDLASFTGAIQTSISRHLSKEEEHVFTMINERFSCEEQASLVWQFLCSLPVNMMAEFLQWLSSSISADEQKDMRECIQTIVPDGKLLQQIIFSWMDEVKTTNKRKQCYDDIAFFSSTVDATQNGNCSYEPPGVVARDVLLSGCSAMYHPVDGILHWHRAIEKELNDVAEIARSITLVGDFYDLSDFRRRLQFIAEVSIFHSISEETVIFPAVSAEMPFVWDHTEDKSEFNKFRCLIESIESAGDTLSVKIYSELCSQADDIMETIKNHFANEETQVLPLARKHFSHKQQQELVYQSICVMPLRLIECVLPWLIGSLSEEEAQHFLYNMHMGAPASDTGLVTLFSGWACKGCPGRLCLSPSALDCCTAEELKEIPEHIGRSNEPATSLQTCKYEMIAMQGNLDSSVQTNLLNDSNMGSAKVSLVNQSCCVPRLGVISNSVVKNSMATSSLRFLLSSFSSPLNSSLFKWETCNSSSNIGGLSTGPIDNIFKCHKAIRKDLEFLAVESGKLGDCDEIFMRNFGRRFHLLWSLYRAHSNAEDDIVFPALESKEALHNVSHSYTLDHKQEGKLFEEISSALAELSQLKEKLNENNMSRTLSKSPPGSLSRADSLKNCKELAMQIQGMCKAIKVVVDDHVMREEIVLWPLFDKHFSVEEQEKIVGRIIGTTSADMLQSMLPWVTSALTQEEQTNVTDTWKRATKNTKFSEWLDEWWEGTSASSSQASTSGKCILQGISNVPSATFSNRVNSWWIASQQKFSQSETSKADDGTDLHGHCQSFHDSEKQIFGCKHYKRNCKLRAACCGKLFPCRFCHDEVSDHPMDRKATSEIMCYNCLEIQPVGPVCSTPSCNGLSMAKYYCTSCKFFEDEREVYHCPFCNLCRVGKGLGVDIFHCMNCNCCLSMKMPEHKCWEKILETNCPICCDFMFTSSALLKDLPCGHYMHIACYHAYAYTNYICPICSKSMGDMSVYFGMLDALMASEVLPEEYRKQCQDILCNDCNSKGTASFHWLYHKCGSCGSYNTKVIKVDPDHSCST